MDDFLAKLIAKFSVIEKIYCSVGFFCYTDLKKVRNLRKVLWKILYYILSKCVMGYSNCGRLQRVFCQFKLFWKRIVYWINDPILFNVIICWNWLLHDLHTVKFLIKQHQYIRESCKTCCNYFPEWKKEH